MAATQNGWIKKLRIRNCMNKLFAFGGGLLFLHKPAVLCLWACIALYTTSCKHRQKIKKEEPIVTQHAVDDSTNDKCKLDYKSGKVLMRHLKENELDFTYLNAKLNCELNMDDENQSFSVSLRCHKDSIIWLSISKLGIEAARVLITRDSVKIVLGLTERKFFKGDFTYINQVLRAELDYDMIQALLLGNSAQFYDDERLKPGKDKNNCNYLLSTVRKRHALRIINGVEQPKDSYQTMWLDPTTYKILMLEFEDPEARRKFNACYEDFQLVDKYLAPFKLLYTIAAEKIIKAELRYAKININEAQKFPFNIPANYEPIEIKK